MADCNICGQYMSSEDIIRLSLRCNASGQTSIQGGLLNVLPIITLIGSSVITDTTATLAATVDPKDSETVVTFEWGTVAGVYPNSVTGATITEPTAVTGSATGLPQNTPIYWRVKAVRADKTVTSDQQTFTTTNARWVIPITGRTSGTAMAGTLVFTATQDVNVTSTGDVTVSTARDADDAFRKHTVTVNCPNNGSGSVVIADRSKVISCGSHQGVADPTTEFYYGNDTTSPILTWNLNDLPSTLQKIRSITTFNNILPASGNSPLPSPLTYIRLIGDNINWTGTNLSGIGNITQLTLYNFRITKMSSADMVTLLTSLTNRIGSLPATITINDYADFAAPPQAVVDAVAALKLAKSITNVQLGA